MTDYLKVNIRDSLILNSVCIFKMEYSRLTDCSSSSYDIIGSTITNIPENTSSDTLISKLILAHGASSGIIQNNTTKAGQIIVKSGDIVKIICNDRF